MGRQKFLFPGNFRIPSLKLAVFRGVPSKCMKRHSGSSLLPNIHNGGKGHAVLLHCVVKYNISLANSFIVKLRDESKLSAQIRHLTFFFHL